MTRMLDRRRVWPLGARSRGGQRIGQTSVNTGEHSHLVADGKVIQRRQILTDAVKRIRLRWTRIHVRAFHFGVSGRRCGVNRLCQAFQGETGSRARSIICSRYPMPDADPAHSRVRAHFNHCASVKTETIQDGPGDRVGGAYLEVPFGPTAPAQGSQCMQHIKI